MTADDIRYFLRLKYSKTWAFYEEFRPFTGFAGNVNQIDAVALGLYEKNKKIVAFEIKVDRADFLKDVSMFNHKHRFALEISNEFYYVCPWDLIDKSEVPDIAGLLYINKGHKIQNKKVAKLRVKDDLPLCFVQAFLQNSKKRVNYADIPVQYLGRNWTQKDFIEEIDKRVEKASKLHFDWKIKEEVNEKLKEKDAIYIKLLCILREANLEYLYEKDSEEAISRLIKKVKTNHNIKRIEEFANDAEVSLSKLTSIIQEELK